MARPLTRTQRRENAAFLTELRRTGNVRLAARTVGIAYGSIQHRRRAHADFAQDWDAALAFAAADCNAAGRSSPRAGRGAADPLRTVGGEAVVTRCRDGRLQLRAAQPGKLTAACEQAFLAALSASANVRLAAAAAGASARAFYRRRRQQPAFAREWRLALETGYARIEEALLASTLETGFSHDDWRRNDPPPIPPMTVEQALQALYLHQKEVRLGGTPEALKRLSPGETSAMRSARLALLHEHRLARASERYRIAEAERLARGEPTQQLWGPGELPDLAQVTGWSRAAGGAGEAPKRALFGGWRMEELRRKREGEGS